jgi:hypothetical protein
MTYFLVGLVPAIIIYLAWPKRRPEVEEAHYREQRSAVRVVNGRAGVYDWQRERSL